MAEEEKTTPPPKKTEEQTEGKLVMSWKVVAKQFFNVRGIFWRLLMTILVLLIFIDAFTSEPVEDYREKQVDIGDTLEEDLSDGSIELFREVDEVIHDIEDFVN